MTVIDMVRLQRLEGPRDEMRNEAGPHLAREAQARSSVLTDEEIIDGVDPGR
jgi:hypothetical protein